MQKLEKVEAYYALEHPYKEAIGILRQIVQKTKLVETYKWNFPTYTLNDKNVMAVCRFNTHFGLWFFNGVMLEDRHQVLENAQEGKTMAMRHWKFGSKNDIDTELILSYVYEAILLQEKGTKPVKKNKNISNLTIPILLMEAFEKNPLAAKAFHGLSPYKQKEYTEYISNAKQEKTRQRRLQKIIPLVLKGVGLNDTYR